MIFNYNWENWHNFTLIAKNPESSLFYTSVKALRIGDISIVIAQNISCI
jgi:hypothetical protein